MHLQFILKERNCQRRTLQSAVLLLKKMAKRVESAQPAKVRAFNRGMHYDYSSMPVKKPRTTTLTPNIDPPFISQAEDACEVDLIQAVERVSYFGH